MPEPEDKQQHEVAGVPEHVDGRGLGTADAPESRSLPRTAAVSPPPVPHSGFTNDWSQAGTTAPPPAAGQSYAGTDSFRTNWSQGYAEATLAAAPPFPGTGANAAYELRPLSTGEILDRTFSLYRRRFWLFVGISAIASGLTVLGQIGRFSFMSWVPAGRIGNLPKETTTSLIFAAVSALIYFFAWSFTQAATISAVSTVYLGNDTSIGNAIRSVRGHWFRYALIVLWQIWSVAWVPFLFIVPALVLAIVIRSSGMGVVVGLLAIVGVLSLIYGLIAYIRNSLAIAASVSEDLPVRRAMRRSKNLVAGRKGRIFLLLLLMYILYAVGGAAQAPFAFMLLKAHAGQRIALEGLTLLMGFVLSALITPVGAIALCLFYVDERVRREGFDIEALMGQSFLGSAVPPLGSLPAVEPATAAGYAPGSVTPHAGSDAV